MLFLQKSRRKNKCPGQVKELPYVRSKKLPFKFCHEVSFFFTRHVELQEKEAQKDYRSKGSII